MMFETSAFRGEEPDENRLNIDRPRLDSWSARASWRQGPWQAQFSGGHLHEPEWFDPYDVTRLTASIAFNGTVASRPLAATLAWGQNRELLDRRARRLPARVGSAPRGTVVLLRPRRDDAKEMLSLGVHPRGLLPGQHPHTHLGHQRADARLRLGSADRSGGRRSASAPTSPSTRLRPISESTSARRSRFTCSCAGVRTAPRRPRSLIDRARQTHVEGEPSRYN